MEINMEIYSSDGEDFSAYSSGSSHYNEYELISEGSSDSGPEDGNDVPNLGVVPYQFEPVPDFENAVAADEVNGMDDRNARLQNVDWCACDNCQPMDRANECCCCNEITQVARQMAEDPGMCSCITQHPRFDAVCLNKHVLEVAWLQYRQQYGRNAYDGPEHKRFRHIAYRQLVRWCWVFLGKNVRVVLPACAVCCIRAHFPPPGQEEDFEFVGFQPA